jgi:hypothetical protein
VKLIGGDPQEFENHDHRPHCMLVILATFDSFTGRITTSLTHLTSKGHYIQARPCPSLLDHQSPYHNKEYVATCLNLPFSITCPSSPNICLHSPASIPPMETSLFVFLIPAEQSFIQLRDEYVVADNHHVWQALRECFGLPIIELFYLRNI